MLKIDYRTRRLISGSWYQAARKGTVPVRGLTRTVPFLLSFLLGGVMALLWGGGASAQAYHDNVVILLDASGSMSQPMGSNSAMKRIGAAKTALKKVLTQIPESTHVGLLVFSKSVPKQWVYPLAARDDAKLVAAIDSMRPGGPTPLGAYMKTAADQLLEARKGQYGYGSYRMLVVTDGEASDEHLVKAFTPEIVARGITMDVIGVDMKAKHTLANKAHSYRRADDPAALEQAISEVFAEVSASGDDAAQAEDFALLEAIPQEVVDAMLDALEKTEDNSPIGGKPRAGAPGPQGTRRAAAPQPAKPGSGGSWMGKWYMPVVVIVAVVVLSRVKRR